MKCCCFKPPSRPTWYKPRPKATEGIWEEFKLLPNSPLLPSASCLLPSVDSYEKRSQLRKRGLIPQFPKRVYKSKKHRGRPIKNDTPRFQQERCFARASKKIQTFSCALGASISYVRGFSGFRNDSSMDY